MEDHNKRRLRLGPNVHPGVWLMGLAAAVMVLFWMGGERVTSLLQYNRTAILHGQYWRLITGHLVHANFRHMALNLAGGAVMAALFARTYSIRHWTIIILASLLVIDIGFLFRDRDLENYVGLSGVLHGVLAAGAVAWWRTETRGMAIALSLITVGKLTWEQWRGPVTLAGDELVVIVNAHLYGAIGGALAGLAFVASGKYWRPMKSSAPSV
jgi:rhomboid family GlyGly-CTERM serine protease